MIWKKNAVSCLMWAAYLFMVGAAMVFTCRAVCDSLGMAQYFEFAIPAAYLALTGALVFGLHQMAVKLNVGAGRAGKDLAWLEKLLVLALFAAGIFLRVAQLQPEGLAQAEEPVYLELAFLSADGQGIPQFVHGAVYLYVCLLRLCFILLGNKAAVAVWLQVALQLSGVLLLHMAVRKMAGRIPAVVMVSFFMLSPYMVKKSLVLSPEMLYLLLFSLVLYFISQGVRFVPKWGFWLVAGVMSAVLCYLDVAGFLLLPLIFGVIVMRRQVAGRKILQGFLGSLAGVLMGAFGCILADVAGSGKPVSEIIGAWMELYRWGDLQLFIRISGFDVMWMIALILCFMTWGVFGFWCGRGVERFTVWIFCLGMAVLLQLSGVFAEEMNGFGYIFLFSTILAGLGIQESMAVYPAEKGSGKRKGKETAVGNDETDDLEIIAIAGTGRTEVMKGKSGETGEMPKKENMETGKIPEKESPETGITPKKENMETGKMPEKESLKAGKIPEKESPETGITPEKEYMATGEMPEAGSMETGENMEKETRIEGQGVEAEEQPGKERRVEFLENPLPLPKKHEKRVMDYRLDSDKELGGYDVYVADDDDFDH